MSTLEDKYKNYTVDRTEIEKIKILLDIDTYKQGPRAGIINATNSCWFNATIQMILCMPKFVLSILGTEQTQNNGFTDEDRTQSHIKQNIFKTFLKQQLFVPPGTILNSNISLVPNTDELRYIIKTCIGDAKEWKPKTQQDAQEGLNALLSLFEPNAAKTNPIYDYNDINVRNYYRFEQNSVTHNGIKIEESSMMTLEYDAFKGPLGNFINNQMKDNNIEILTCEESGRIIDININIAWATTKLKEFINALPYNEIKCNLLNEDIVSEINIYITNYNIYITNYNKNINDADLPRDKNINVIDAAQYKLYYIKKSNSLVTLNYIKKTIYYTKLNKYFIIHLRIFAKELTKITKDINPIQYKLFIDDKHYVLSGFIVHIGRTMNEGHYVFYKITSENTYILYDDSTVTKSDTTNNMLQFTKDTYNKIFISVKNTTHTPYVLLYERDDSNNNDITFNLTFNDVFGDH